MGEKLTVTITLEADVAELGTLLAETADDLRQLGLRMAAGFPARAESRLSPTPSPQSSPQGEEVKGGREPRCQHCGKPLVRRPREQKYGFEHRKYCSRSCAGKARTKAKVVAEGGKSGRNCLFCGKPIVRKRYERGNLETPKHLAERRFCGNSCSVRYRMAQEAKEAAPKPQAAKPNPPQSPLLGGKPKAGGLPEPTQDQPSPPLTNLRCLPLPDPRDASDYEPIVMKTDLPRCEKHGDILGAYGCPTCNASAKRREAERANPHRPGEIRSTRGTYEV